MKGLSAVTLVLTTGYITTEFLLFLYVTHQENTCWWKSQNQIPFPFGQHELSGLFFLSNSMMSGNICGANLLDWKCDLAALFASFTSFRCQHHLTSYRWTSICNGVKYDVVTSCLWNVQSYFYCSLHERQKV